MLEHRFATVDDVPLLARLNQQLIRDEGHRNRMTLPELEDRMRGWLWPPTDVGESQGEYTAVLFLSAGEVVSYALYREGTSDVYLRQFFVVRERRRQGCGRSALEILRSEVWPRDKRLTVDVLTSNSAAIDFWRAVGYVDYCLTLEIMPPDRPGG